jgi:hypothetical protein
VEELEEQLETFSNTNIYPGAKEEVIPVQDFRVPFLVTLTFKQLKDHVYKNRAKYGRIKFSDYFVKPETMQRYVTQYANQLMRANDWQQALLVTQFMPITERRLRKHMTF